MLSEWKNGAEKDRLAGKAPEAAPLFLEGKSAVLLYFKQIQDVVSTMCQRHRRWHIVETTSVVYC